MTTLETRESAELSSTNKELADLKKEVDDGRKPKSKGGANAEVVGEVSMEYSIASAKLQNFMSASAPDDTGVEDWELRQYHFDTVNWGRNAKPHPKMVIAEIKTLDSGKKDIINKFLQANPARIKQLQQRLNEMMPQNIDMKKLNYILSGTGMELDWYVDNRVTGNTKRQKIKEDGMLGPQTYAAICCIYRKNNIDNLRKVLQLSGGNNTYK